MNTFSTLAIVLGALANTAPEQRIAAPTPKEPPSVSIEGKYNLVSVSLADDRAGGPGGLGGRGGGVVIGGPGGRVSANAAYMAGPATITKNEITLEGNPRVSPLVNSGPQTMEYTFGSSKKTIDLETFSIRGKKSKLLGVVEIIGNRMVIAVAREGDERPKNTEEADGVTLYFFQKAPPPPRTEFKIVAMTVGKEEATEKELNKLAQEGYELVSTTQPTAANDKGAVTTVHFVLKRSVKP